MGFRFTVLHYKSWNSFLPDHVLIQLEKYFPNIEEFREPKEKIDKFKFVTTWDCESGFSWFKRIFENRENITQTQVQAEFIISHSGYEPRFNLLLNQKEYRRSQMRKKKNPQKIKSKHIFAIPSPSDTDSADEGSDYVVSSGTDSSSDDSTELAPDYTKSDTDSADEGINSESSFVVT